MLYKNYLAETMLSQAFPAVSESAAPCHVSSNTNQFKHPLSDLGAESTVPIYSENRTPAGSVLNLPEMAPGYVCSLHENSTSLVNPTPPSGWSLLSDTHTFDRAKWSMNAPHEKDFELQSWSCSQDIQALSLTAPFIAMTSVGSWALALEEKDAEGAQLATFSDAATAGASLGPVELQSGPVSVSAAPWTQPPKVASRVEPALNLYSLTNLFVSKLPYAMQDEELEKLFAPYGTIVRSIILRDIHTGRSLRKGFVRYETHEQAERAMAMMNALRKKGEMFPNISVEWAKRQHDNVPAGEASARLRKVFVRNIPQDVTPAMLESLFKPFGAIEGITLHRDTDAARQSTKPQEERRIAFVTFSTEGVAEKAAKTYHNKCPFLSCHGIPLMVKAIKDEPVRQQNQQGPINSPTRGSEHLKRCGAAGPPRGGVGVSAVEESNTFPTVRTNSTVNLSESVNYLTNSGPVSLQCTYSHMGHNTLCSAPALRAFPALFPTQSITSPLQNCRPPLDANDTAACPTYNSLQENCLAYPQISSPSSVTVRNPSYLYRSPEHALLQPFSKSGPGSNSSSTAMVSLRASDATSPASVPLSGMLWYKRLPPPEWLVSRPSPCTATLEALHSYTGSTYVRDGTLENVPSAPVVPPVLANCTPFGNQIEQLNCFTRVEQEARQRASRSDWEAHRDAAVGGLAHDSMVGKEPFNETTSTSNSGMVCFPSYTAPSSLIHSDASESSPLRCGREVNMEDTPTQQSLSAYRFALG